MEVGTITILLTSRVGSYQNQGRNIFRREDIIANARRQLRGHVRWGSQARRGEHPLIWMKSDRHMTEWKPWVWKVFLKVWLRRGRGKWERTLERKQGQRRILFVCLFLKIWSHTFRLQEDWCRLRDESRVKRILLTHEVLSCEEQGGASAGGNLLKFALLCGLAVLFLPVLFSLATAEDFVSNQLP